MLVLVVSVPQRYGVPLFFGTPFGIGAFDRGETTLVLRDGTILQVRRRRAARIKDMLSPARRSPPETDRSPHPV